VLQGDKERCLAAGMDDYISKPLKQSDLAAAIDRARTHNDHVPDPTADERSESLVDMKTLRELHELEDESQPRLVEQLLRTFLHETPGRIENLRKCHNNNDALGLYQTAHLLTGSCKQLGLTALVHCCRTLEEHGLADSLDGTASAIDAFDETFRRTMGFLEEEHFTIKV
jgi:HPt (histidine-containing phosphotransfer) domain-containing protein